MFGLDILIMFALAIAIDLAMGEPPRIVHPVVWIGKVIALLTKAGNELRPATQFIYGLSIVLLTTTSFVVAVYFLLLYLRELNFIAYVIIGSLLLKPTFSLRELHQTILKVKRLLKEGKLDKARFELRSLVSRDTTGLNESQIVAATVESAAENSCDSFIAPLFYFLIFGVPGALAYRVINTFDAMIGYHDKWEHLGKFAARLDDVVNFIPARVTALLILISAMINRKNLKQAWRIMLRDHAKTESPNAGWTMSAIAGALDVQLEKAGYYKLGDNHYSLSLNTIDASRQLTIMAALIWSVIYILTEVAYLVAT